MFGNIRLFGFVGTTAMVHPGCTWNTVQDVCVYVSNEGMLAASLRERSIALNIS